MECGQLDEAQLPESSLFAGFHNPGSLRLQIWIAEQNVIVLENRRTDEVLEIQLRHFARNTYSRLSPRSRSVR